MRPRLKKRLLSAAVAATTVMTVVAAPATANTGWLDPTFSGDGWVRLEGRDGGPIDLVVAAGPNGRTVVGREVLRDEAAIVESLVLSSTGTPLPTFNGGEWRWMIDVTDSADMPLFAATSGGGAITAHGGDATGTLRIRELDAGGDFVGSRDHDLNGFNEANIVRLSGGSLRTCYQDDSSSEERLLGFTPTLEPDPAVGPNGQRAIPIEPLCHSIAPDNAGHLYIGRGSFGAADGSLVLLRTTTSGVVDTGWSGDGQTTITRPGLGIDFPEERITSAPDFNDSASPIVPLADGSVLIAARVTRDPAAETWSAAVIKLTPDGALDPSFDSDGIRAFGPDGGESWVLAMAADSQGRSVVSVVYKTSTGRKAYLVRFTDDGRFDSTFGRGGRIQQTYGASSVAIDAAGRILTAAWDGTEVIVARRNG